MATMMRSLFAGVSALRNHQVRMDVIGNNIANVNTIGYKAQSVTFKEQLAQTLRGAGAPERGRGGTNPQQVGLGVDLGAITTIHTPGSLQSTGVESDVAIEGNGFFILSDGNQTFYTRSGVFDFDRDGNLVSLLSGLKVMGYTARDGQLDYTRGLVPIEIPLSTTLPPTPTTEARVEGNLDARGGGPAETTLRVFDSLGTEHDVFLSFSQLEANRWEWIATDIDGNEIGSGELVYDTSGALSDSTNSGTIRLEPPGAEELEIELDFSRLTQYADETDVSKTWQNGFPSGTLTSISIDVDGRIYGLFSNGRSAVLAQFALADFANPAGLVKADNGTFVISANSGQPDVGAPGTGARGSIRPGALEMSNVDLSKEFTEMIVTQRGFQANSRIITTSDEMLQELVNLKR